MNTLPALSALSLALSVACGAFGAHGLRNSVSPVDLAIWEKAVLYQMIHSLGALVLLLSRYSALTQRRVNQIATLFLASTVVFSGSLYLLVLLQQRWLGAITPLGGTGFIVAWILVAVSLGRRADPL